MTTVLMVSGSWPPQVCGVGDYAEQLSLALERGGLEVIRFASDRLSRLWSPETVREIAGVDCDLIHIQYPTVGYRRSLTPSRVASVVRDKPVIVTLHEYSVFRWYRRAWFAPFAQHAAARIFTTDDERALFAARFAVRAGSDRVIEIASNIPRGAVVARQPNSVVYFGLIAPNKGIEAFLDLAEIARTSAADLNVSLLGAVPRQHRDYAASLLDRAVACDVQVSLELPAQAVADRLSAATFAYLPFPDGASARRGSLAAALVNGLIVLTPYSAITPDWIRAGTVEAGSPFEALRRMTHLQGNGSARAGAAANAEQAAGRLCWDAIAQRHVDLYESLLNVAPDYRSDLAPAGVQDAAYESRLAS